MERRTLELPSLCNGHHVAAVHAVLRALPGLTQVYASAIWHLVRGECGPDQATAEAARQAPAGRGYTTNRQNLPPVSGRTPDLTDLATWPGGAEQFVEHGPVWSAPGAPYPGFEVQQPGEVHPAAQR